LEWNDPDLGPRDPEVFRRRVDRRATQIRRGRRLKLAGGATTGLVALAILAAELLPAATPGGGSSTLAASGRSTRTAPVRSGATLPSAPTTTGGGTPTTAGPTPAQRAGNASGTAGTQHGSAAGVARPGAGGTGSSGGPGSTTTEPAPTTTTEPVATTTPSSTLPSTTTTTGVTPTGVAVAASCGQPAAPSLAIDATTLRHALVGTWLVCRGWPTIFGAGVVDVGIQIMADGTWVRIGVNDQGTLIPLGAVEDTGTWRVLPSPAASSAPTVGFFPTTGAAVGLSARPEIAPGPPQRVEFVESGLSAMYRRTTRVVAGPEGLTPPPSAGSAGPGPTPG
jgi:hypothetical protein